jgi:hypothetical protein
MTNNLKITPAIAAICRDLFEGGDGSTYFGSLIGFTSHARDASYVGLITIQSDEKGYGLTLTEKGRMLGFYCKDLPKRRYAGSGDMYRKAINEFQEAWKNQNKGKK